MPPWQKSSFSGPADGSQCVELARDKSNLLLRESDDPDHILTLTPGALSALISHATQPGTTREEFNLPSERAAPSTTHIYPRHLATSPGSS
ncbi:MULTISPECIES: DUF397 domain-containing protein [Streptomyces]|uniref:DUF397 domain-containing protein n=1 Tax=Streptomyces venezuelae TaxID=54571 RepID=A0A5P2BJ29_STRVZ|nr:DUF397 domain-containing protein [Streptomyces venezuelae]MYY81842.1 DUF397 domain-containing protein [Streptomyces sp. SID335]MYZ13560.1 DUF397 domain-containing protein [Streptomyces sp. SID337]NDZ89948.1 DUF397 domain-containing protein [Streptomyces sp. SID10115]NEA01972.1 DUF397 domain-containing protein [Streptomyces sp. SID10116]NEB45659.1 DUF397 domain-containing protein [Streptomyces sp. SID339]